MICTECEQTDCECKRNGASMTDLSEDQKRAMREHLAVVVLKLTSGETEYQWNQKDGSRYLDGRLFDPFEFDDQTHDCLDTFPAWGAGKSLTHQDHSVTVEGDGACRRRHKDFRTAACLAMCAASGYEPQESNMEPA